MSRILRLIKVVLKLFLVLVLMLIVFGGFQSAMYYMEGGFLVADTVEDTPISLRYSPAGIIPLAERDNLSWYDKWMYWRALRKFPTLEHCLVSGSTNLSDFNWKSLRTEEQAKICVFHVAEKLKHPEKVRDWMIDQGFTGYFSEATSNLSTYAQGSWRANIHGSLSPFSGFSEFGMGDLFLRFVTILGLPIERPIQMTVRFFPDEPPTQIIQIRFGRSFK